MYGPEDVRLPWAAPGRTSEARPYDCRFDAAGRHGAAGGRGLLDHTLSLAEEANVR